MKVRHGEPGGKPGRPPQAGERGPDVAGALQREAQVIARLGVVGLELHRPLESGQRAGGVSRPPPRRPEVVPRIEEVRPCFRHLLELRQRFLGAALLSAHEPEAVASLGQSGREREGMLVRLGRAGQIALLLPFPAELVAGQRAGPGVHRGAGGGRAGRRESQTGQRQKGPRQAGDHGVVLHQRRRSGQRAARTSGRRPSVHRSTAPSSR